MKPRSIAVAVVFAVSFVTAIHAQAPSRAERFKAVATQLNLTREQERQLIPILAAEEPKLEAIKNDTSLSRMEKLQRLKAIHDESNPQVKAILTPEQYQQLQEIRQKRRAEIMQAAKNRPPQ
jgi:protein CpxP